MAICCDKKTGGVRGKTNSITGGGKMGQHFWIRHGGWSSRTAGPQGKGKGGKGKREDRCWICDGVGHYKNECPNQNNVSRREPNNKRAFWDYRDNKKTNAKGEGGFGKGMGWQGKGQGWSWPGQGKGQGALPLPPPPPAPPAPAPLQAPPANPPQPSPPTPTATGGKGGGTTIYMNFYN